MSAFRRFLDVIEAVQRAAIFVLFIGIIVVVFFQVLNRFWFHLPIVWTSDLSVIIFIWLSFLSASNAVRHRGHFRMSALIDLAGDGPFRRSLELLSIAVGFALFGMLVFTGFDMAVRGMREVSPGLRLPMIWAYASVPLSFATMILFSIEQLIGTLRGEPLHTDTAEQLALAADQKGDP